MNRRGFFGLLAAACVAPAMKPTYVQDIEKEVRAIEHEYDWKEYSMTVTATSGHNVTYWLASDGPYWSDGGPWTKI